ncbi:Hypp6358 [Branchiostoma lanceolatum]|uniref:Hypp6358 protein n=1 Tax=Branchiostoma lanceolatum TaxID=7740 RepID=A0A8J9YTG0_BRALA|nr:Hypp6358 [Branchiostoma lanceolatum]
MARPGDDEFEWNDFDFSDFSDFEDDFDEIEAESDSEEYDPVGGGNATSAGAGGRAELACDVCGKVYKYAGSLSKHKAKDHGTSTEAPQPGTSKAPQPGTSKTGEERGSPDNTSLTGPDKATKSKRKLRVKRPASVFQKEDALKEGPELVKGALEVAAAYRPWLLEFGSMTTPGNSAAKAAEAILGIVGTPDFNNFAIALCALLWIVIIAGDQSVLCNAATEAMWAEYYNMCTSDGYYSLWDSSMASIGKSQCPLLYQFVSRKVLEGLLRKKHSVDVPSASASNTDITISSHEEQVLRYIAGYIPHALLRRYQRFSNKTAQVYVAVLQKWKVSAVTKTQTTFLEYTKGWVDRVNRGGLFLVTDDVYLFFRVVEKVVRTTANFDQVCKHKLTGIKEDIMKNLESNYLVNHYWSTRLACSITSEKASIALLETVLSYYVSLRCRSFAEAYMLVTNHRNKNASKKGEKCLRKSLNKS